MNPKRNYFFNEQIIDLALKNTHYRKEIFTAAHSQIVLMSVPVGGELPKEIHKVDQMLFFVQGQADAFLNDLLSPVLPYHLVSVPAGVEHRFKNTGQQELKLISFYAPAEHKPGTIEG
jgi:mannose-6-phosphate isomerase-like protein (cupin superfamily)